MLGVGLMSVALVCVVSGERYEAFAKDMFASAFEYFGPDPVVAHIALPGREGWPDATLYRYHVLLENSRMLDGFDYVYMIDADMRFEGPVGDEILGERVATRHPGYVNRSRSALPYEDRFKSAAWVGDYSGFSYVYYAGGFVGGKTEWFLGLAGAVAHGIERDAKAGIVARWHDESHMNASMAAIPPTVVLSPSYCYPDDASSYKLDGCERKIVALDKTPAERGTR